MLRPSPKGYIYLAASEQSLIYDSSQKKERLMKRQKQSQVCRKCGDDAFDASNRGAYLRRVNEFGVDGIWECAPGCHFKFSDDPDAALLGALEDNQKLVK